MKVRTSRRTFIEATAAGLAGAALPASRAVAAPAAPDAVERQRLIELAHFGKKAPAEGTGGMAITSHPLATRPPSTPWKRAATPATRRSPPRSPRPWSSRT